MSSIVQIAPRTGGPLLNGRTLLWCAWTLPALLTIPKLSSPSAIAAALAVAAGLAGVLAFLPAKLWRLSCAAGVLALPFTIWWCGSATLGGAGPGYEAAVAALQTNAKEAHGALAVVAAYPSFFVAIAAHGLCLFLACKAALGQKSADAERHSEGPWVKIALLASLLSLAVIALLSIPSGRTDVPLFGVASLASPLGSLEEIVQHRIRLLAWYRDQGYRRRAARGSMQVTRPMLAVFIVGESVRAGSYGPNQGRLGPANRQLAERVAAGLGSWLPNTCAASDGTHLSVPMLLTNTPPTDKNAAPTAPTVLGILHADGFSTAWLANNESGPDGREAGHDLYAGAFRINPDESLWNEQLQNWKLDEDALPVAKRFASDIDRPKAMILHLIGSHFPYEARYPPGFFPAEPTELGREARTRLRYERSLEYGAHIILEVAAVLDATTAPAFLVYTSDHGENLPDDHSGFILHLGPRTNQLDGTVSSFVLWNRAMAATGRPAQALAKLTHERQIAHADVSQLFLSLAGVAPVPVEPTANPTIWGRISIGDEYAAVPCSALKP